MTIDQMRRLMESLREFHSWLENEHPGAIDLAVISWTITTVETLIREALDARP